MKKTNLILLFIVCMVIAMLATVIYMSNDKAHKNKLLRKATMKVPVYERISEDDVKSVYYRFKENDLYGIKVKAAYTSTGKDEVVFEPVFTAVYFMGSSVFIRKNDIIHTRGLFGNHIYAKRYANLIGYNGVIIMGGDGFYDFRPSGYGDTWGGIGRIGMVYPEKPKSPDFPKKKWNNWQNRRTQTFILPTRKYKSSPPRQWTRKNWLVVYSNDNISLLTLTGFGTLLDTMVISK